MKGSAVLSYCHGQKWRIDRLMHLNLICELQKQLLQWVPPPECKLVQQLALHLGHLERESTGLLITQQDVDRRHLLGKVIEGAVLERGERHLVDQTRMMEQTRMIE